MIEMRELAVIGPRGNPEVDGAVAAVGVPVAIERGDELAHRGDVRLVGGARRLLDRFQPEHTRVFAERGDVLLGVAAQIHGSLLRAVDRAVVDVGVVDHLPDLVAEQMPQGSAQHIHADEGAKVADMAARVDGQAAGVDAHGVVAQRRKDLLSPAQRVEQAHRHRSDRAGGLKDAPAVRRHEDLQPAVLGAELHVAAPLAECVAGDGLLEGAGQLRDVLARAADMLENLRRQLLDERGLGALAGELEREIELMGRHVSAILQ
jgi:hypothetical protein